MFLGQLLSCTRTCVTSQTSRFFSTTSTMEAGYKMKSHSGAKKRWRSLASGSDFKRGKANHSHLNVSKNAGRINRLGATAYATDTQAVKLKKRLLPYGSS
ncbi:hypothetical protein BDZ94DRAFT_528054 [Collybia nuda]|uniref:50S ribosomal protein L35 n=1 Tax=Collybia nuda TaxID=64659 RepID=A0A9P5Y6H1_9AGAR|nr:hypothetical protein BDZ94DRAFT_528054 [Collybia nuda]